METTIAILKRRWLALTATIVVLAVTAAGVVTHKQWLPTVKEFLAGADSREEGCGHDHAGHDHSSHVEEASGQAHDHEGHDESEALELSALAWKNVGVKTDTVRLRSYVKTISVPAMVVERPGRSQVEITAPMTGIVTRIYRIEGEAVQSDEPLFDMRLTHEDLVTAQRDFLRSAEELAVVNREIDRLESVAEGVLAGTRVLEQKYQQQKIEAALHAQRQALLLHGLTDAQIDEILATRKLLPTLTIAAPPFADDGEHHEADHLYHVQGLHVKRGQHVSAGDALGVLADHCLLHVEGQAFEDDAERLVAASKEGWQVTVSPVADGLSAGPAVPLRVFYVSDHVDSESRALKFYLSLPNELVHTREAGQHRFVAWKYRPGQRMQVKIPAGSPLENQIVLPPEAIVDEGADAFVFEQNGDHFDRIPVHVLCRDRDAVVIENDGSLIGATLAVSGAYQMHLALKNKAGGGIDPHAGHNH